MSRYTGPPITPIKSKSEGSLIPADTVPENLQIAKPPKRVGSGYRSRKHHSNSKCYGNYNYPPEAYESFYSNWDLIPAAPEKPFPNWDVHKSIPQTLARLSPKTLRHLTRHEIIDNMPTIPSPHDLALINLLQNKLAAWERAEEDLFLRRKGWYCDSKHVENRAWVSWAMTQNRDFGSAVWRWLRLDHWDAAQTPRMKGLYEQLFDITDTRWHQAVYG
jgi:hypothetical protein